MDRRVNQKNASQNAPRQQHPCQNALNLFTPLEKPVICENVPQDIQKQIDYNVSN